MHGPKKIQKRWTAGRGSAISRNEKSALLYRNGVAAFLTLIVAAPVAVTTRLEGVENDNISRYTGTGCSRKSQFPNLDRQ